MNKRYATIDIGTNTILMLIAEKINNNNFKVLHNEHSIARLGEGLGNRKIIIPNALRRAVKILNNYKNICKEYNVFAIKIVATSALRDAENKDEIKKSLEKSIGTKIEIISGEEEAKYSYLGTVETDKTSAVIDIGGGSTEIIFGKNDKILQTDSLQIGAVRLTEKYLKENPLIDSNIVIAREKVINHLNKINYKFKTDLLFAVAGTPTNLAAIDLGIKGFNEEKIQGYVLSFEKISNIFNNLKKMTTKQITREYGINTMRADVIGAGTLILMESMKYFGFDKCIVSTKGLRYGVMKTIIK